MADQLVQRNFQHESGAPAKNVAVMVTLRGDATVIETLTTDSLGAVAFYIAPGQYDFHTLDYTVPFDVVDPVAAGVEPAALAERVPNVHTLGTSPFTFTCPEGRIVQLTVTGGSGVAIAVNPGNGSVAFIGGTGASVILTPGEAASVSWTTVPNAIRTRALLELTS